MSVPATEVEQSSPEQQIEQKLENMFGEPTPEPAPQEPQEAPETVAADADPGAAEDAPLEAPEEPTADGADGADGADASSQTHSSSDTQEIETAADLAEFLSEEGYEIDVGSLYKLTFPVRQPDGSDRLTSIGEWKDAEQERLRSTQDLEKFAAERQRFEQERDVQVQQLTAYQTQLQAVMEQTEQLILAESADLQSLRESDPAEYAARSQEMQNRRAYLESLKAHAVQSQHAAAQQLQAQHAAARSEVVARERSALMEKLPAWQDPEKLKAGQAAVTNFLLESGFSAEEVGALIDHRLVLMAEQARAYAESVKTSNAAKKKRFSLGKKPLQPGAKQRRAEQAQDREREHRNALRKSGRAEDAAALYDAALQRMGF
jgi:hypothetical protein